MALKQHFGYACRETEVSVNLERRVSGIYFYEKRKAIRPAPDRRFSGVLSGVRHLFRVYFKNSDGLLQHPHRRLVSDSDPRRLSAEPQCPV